MPRAEEAPARRSGGWMTFGCPPARRSRTLRLWVLAAVVIGVVAACITPVHVSTPAGAPDPLAAELRRIASDMEYVLARREEVLRELALCEVELARREWELSWRRAQLGALVRMLYELGAPGVLDLLLSARDGVELLNAVGALQEACARLEALAREVQEDTESLRARRMELEALRDRLDRAAAELADRQAFLRERLRALSVLSGEFGRVLAARQAVVNLPARELAMCFPVEGAVSSGFGLREHPILGVPDFHPGVDIAAPEGAPVRAAESGLVLQAGPFGDYGNVVVVDHGGGVATVYAHLSRCAVVSGQRVWKGCVVGWVGSTGLSTGPHLHFEVRRWGVPGDPLRDLR